VKTSRRQTLTLHRRKKRKKKRKARTLHLCIDLKKFNYCIRSEYFPLPTGGKITKELFDARCFPVALTSAVV